MPHLPASPMEDHKLPLSRKTSGCTKRPKTSHRIAKKFSSPKASHCIEQGRKLQRVWKACERCRMKKTKCDREFPCRKCKDDGLVCTLGRRHKAEFKQLPRGYAEFLQNTQYALVATIQKLYTMVRNRESWHLGEPGLSGTGQPVTHDIASKLGCLRQFPDLPYDFLDRAEHPITLQTSRHERGSDDTGSIKDGSLPSSQALAPTDGASNSASEALNISKYNQTMLLRPPASEITPIIGPGHLNFSETQLINAESSYEPWLSTHINYSMPSICIDLQTESPMLCNTAAFSSYSERDEFLWLPHSLDPTTICMTGEESQDILRLSPMNNELDPASGTITPSSLGHKPKFNPTDQMGSINDTK